ncbi:hypothetical protein [Azospirillum sp. ST 5-10]|uniref:hypothetical protein n=1 Tax=unclassified Azospirillum TaxID=2630922 RepID=UPI003F4A7641
MSEALRDIRGDFEYLFRNLCNPDFCLTYKCHTWNERDLLPLIRFYLLGAYGDKLVPEYWVRHAFAQHGDGRVDFLIGRTAVEVAVQPEQGTRGKLTRSANTDECVKLMQHDGPSALVLFDFARVRTLSPQDLADYRDTPSLGRGNWSVSGFNILYFHRVAADCACETLNIRC